MPGTFNHGWYHHPKIIRGIPKARNLVRSMPNTPGQIGHGITGYLFAQFPSNEDRKIIEKVLSSLGSVYELREEEDLDRITAISGSGPAYVFEFTCALEEAARAIGLSGKLAREIALGTVTGATHLMQNSQMHPQELRDQVTSLMAPPKRHWKVFPPMNSRRSFAMP